MNNEKQRLCRKLIVFEGRVQAVGFRFETQMAAEKLGLTGTVRNEDDGTVTAQMQGTEENINAYIDKMLSIPRIVITKYTVTDIPVIESEDRFRIEDRYY